MAAIFRALSLSLVVIAAITIRDVLLPQFTVLSGKGQCRHKRERPTKVSGGVPRKRKTVCGTVSAWPDSAGLAGVCTVRNLDLAESRT